MVELTANLRKIQLLMNNLDKFRYSFDDPSQLNITLKNDPYEKVNQLKSNNLNQLLSTSVKVSKKFSQILIMQ